MDDVTKIAITGVISLTTGFIIGRTAERRALVNSVVERYLEKARSDTDLQGDQFLRIGALQSAGAAELRPWEFSRVCRRIAARGFRDPNEDLSLFPDRRRRHVRSLLRWAARNGIIIADAETLLRIAAEESDAQRTKQET
jgi:hypothetical protein